MRLSRHFIGFGAVLVLAAGAYAQTAISARSGMIHYTEGKVLVAGAPVVLKANEFPAVNEGAELRTEEGRAEVLLTPGAFLRVAENSAFKMLSSSLTDTRIEVLEGSVILECAEMLKGNQLTLRVAGAEAAIRKEGVYRVDAADKSIRVYDGSATVSAGGQSLTLKGGRQVRLAAVLASDKFDRKAGDPFSRWAARRAEYIAMANLSAARSFDPGYGGRSGFWHYNSHYGMFTFIPGSGYYHSFFGPFFYSPRYVWNLNRPAPSYSSPGHDMPTHNPSYGYSTGAGRGSGGYQNSTAPSAPASAPASNPRSGDSASPRDGGGGRGR